MPYRCQSTTANSAPRSATRTALRLVVAYALVAGWVASSPDTQAQGKDDLWDVTVKMEMPGMPVAMPPQTYRVCLPKSGSDDAYVPKQDNCKVVESKRVGNKQTFKTICSGKDPMEMVGEITYGSGSYDGRSQMKGRMEGQPIEMTQNFSGKRVGDCTAPAK